MCLRRHTDVLMEEVRVSVIRNGEKFSALEITLTALPPGYQENGKTRGLLIVS